MYTMLIVDDNPSDRRGLVSIVDWRELGIEIIGVCSNGLQAMQKVMQKQVDIVLTDIVMPIMNGIELAERINSEYSKTKVIFMSCYNEFEYARSAVDMDIHGYVMKPVIPDDMIKVVRKLLDKYLQENKKEAEKEAMRKQIHEMLPLVQEQFLKELLLTKSLRADYIWRRVEYLQFGVSPGSNILVVSYLLDDYETRMHGLEPEDIHYFSFSIKDMIVARSNIGMKAFTLQFSGKDYSSVIFLGCDADCRDHEKVMDMAVDIHTGILSYNNISTTIGISKMSSDIADLPKLYSQSREAVNSSFYCCNNPIIHYDIIESRQYATLDQTVNLEKLYLEIKEIITSGDEAAAVGFVDRYLKSNDTIIMTESYIKSLMISIVNMIAVVLVESGSSFADIFGSDLTVWEKMSRFKTIFNIRQWILNIFKALREHFNDRNITKSLKLVETVKQIVRERYHERITVEDISKAVYFSQGYANSIFKKETGKTIFDYLLEYRMEKAKKFLVESDSKVYDVAEKVGYENKSYFSLVFKKYVGLSPMEYKAKSV